MIGLEVVGQLVPEAISGHLQIEARLGQIRLVHGVGLLQGHPLDEGLLAVDDEVVEEVGPPHHLRRPIRVEVVEAPLSILLEAVVGDGPQLVRNIPHDAVVRGGIEPPSGRSDVDQPSDDARLGVRDLDGAVGPHPEHGVQGRRVGGLELLVHRHVLVGDDGVDSGVVLDAGQVPVVLDRDEGVVLEHLHGESGRRGCQGPGVERGGVTLEQLRDHVEDRALAAPGLAVEDDELLDVARVAGDDRPDRPLDLLALTRVVQRRDELLVRRNIPRLEGVRQPTTRVLLLAHRSVRERQLRVEVVGVVTQAADVGLALRPHAGREVSEVLHAEVPVAPRPAVLVQGPVDQALDVVLISGPQTALLVPHRVEVPAPDHQVVRAQDLPVGPDLDRSALRRPFGEGEEIESRHSSSNP